jgi:hypothetical protein
MAKKNSMTVQLVNESNPETGTKYIITVPTGGTKSTNKLRLHATPRKPSCFSYGMNWRS